MAYWDRHGRLALLMSAAMYGVMSWSGAQATSLAAVESVIEVGDWEQARVLLNRLEAVAGADPQWRYLRGIVAYRSGDHDLAARIFEHLHRQHPETPEPGNNLAVVLAGQGRTIEALQVLEEVLRAHPDDHTARANLAALHGQAARQAGHPDAANRQRTAPSAFAPGAARRPAYPAPGSVSGPPPMAPAVSAPVTLERTPVPPRIPAVASGAWQAQQQWLKAWQEGDVESYLRFYADDFQPPLDRSRAQWEQDRRARVPLARQARISLDQVDTRARSDDTIEFRFRQGYRSERYSDQTRKRLVWGLRDARWQILREQVLQ